MLGPLPRLYRVGVSLAALVVFVAGGAWAAFVLPIPLLVSAGASVGLALGVVCAYLLLHEPHGPVAHQRSRHPRY